MSLLEKKFIRVEEEVVEAVDKAQRTTESSVECLRSASEVVALRKQSEQEVHHFSIG
jgi:hypothetical protein